MNFEVGKIFNSTITAMRDKKSVIVNKGGTRSGKTWSLLQVVYVLATNKKNVLISIVGESLSFLKRGAMRDFQTMLGNTWNPDWWNATDKVYTIPTTGSAIEFFSADNEGKVHGSSRDYLFINECYFIGWEIYRQLSVRTRAKVLLDYNPRSRFWVDEHLLGRKDVALIHSTYKDNPFLTARQVAEIESYKGNNNWWRVYGEGQTGTIEGLIYTNWDIVDTMPTGLTKWVVGIDFGYSDPTAIVRVALAGGELYVEQLCHKSGMNNSEIATVLKNNGCTMYTPIVADSAEPKSIAELNAQGLSVKPSPKGSDSVANGIQVVQRYKMHVTADSVDVINELRNYAWKTDSSGKPLGVPEHPFSHSMDALRYAVATYFSAKVQQRPPRAAWAPLYDSDDKSYLFGKKRRL